MNTALAFVGISLTTRLELESRLAGGLAERRAQSGELTGIRVLRGCFELKQGRVVAGCDKIGWEVPLNIGESFISAVGWD